MNDRKHQKQGFDFSLWKQAIKIRGNASEELRRRALKELRDALRVLSEKYQWDEVYIFGSILHRGQFSERSDLDIGLKGLDKFQHYRFMPISP